MKKFNLMQILPSLNSGGVEQGTVDLANHIAKKDNKNYIVSNGGRMLSYLNKKHGQSGVWGLEVTRWDTSCSIN